MSKWFAASTLAGQIVAFSHLMLQPPNKRVLRVEFDRLGLLHHLCDSFLGLKHRVLHRVAIHRFSFFLFVSRIARSQIENIAQATFDLSRRVAFEECR